MKGGVRSQLKRIQCKIEGPQSDDEKELKKVRSVSSGNRMSGPSSKSVSAFLTSMYLTGRMSAPELQQGCQSAASSSATCSELAKSGASGKYRGNVHRDVTSKLGKKSDMPELYYTHIPFWDPKTDAKCNKLCAFLLPYEIADHVISKSESSLDEWGLFGLNVHLQTTMRDWKQRVGLSESTLAVGCGIWGDSAAFNQDSIYALLFNMLSGPQAYTRHWICAWSKRVMCQCGCGGRCTIDAVFRVLAWAFCAWLAGEYPAIVGQYIELGRAGRASVQRCWACLGSFKQPDAIY